jgi:hypothetical protein
MYTHIAQLSQGCKLRKMVSRFFCGVVRSLVYFSKAAKQLWKVCNEDYNRATRLANFRNLLSHIETWVLLSYVETWVLFSYVGRKQGFRPFLIDEIDMDICSSLANVGSFMVLQQFPKRPFPERPFPKRLFPEIPLSDSSLNNVSLKGIFPSRNFPWMTFPWTKFPRKMF